jgi:1-deoxy-D-xylulose-5-phosphate synthase
MPDTTTRFPLIAGLAAPSDIRAMSDAEREALAAEMREAIIDTVSQTGGHLGASLGTVELTIALHAELESPRDRIVWDVGHQAYGHKLLTGRLDGFCTLRQHGGMSGFLRRVESEHDVMGAGHASTSISYATGLAEAERHSRNGSRAVCVIGDGALTGGMAYEGLNQAGALGSPITVILNDNGMSISENVGALSKLFQRVRVDPTLTRVREELEKGLSRLPGASELGGHIRDATKSLWFVPGALFEALGFAYIGPIDGHDIEGVRRALRTTLEMNRPVVLHVKTVKGRGYAPAEADGEAMHGATPFVVESGKAAGRKAPGPPSYTEVFGRALVAEAERDPRVVGITAAMLKGTGMQHMMDRFPERTYDVGIAEQHAVVFACGLAIAGYRPVCAIYSTFLQRAFDPIVHDVAIQELPVVFAIDRGGLVGDDGPTHHGVFDLAYLRAIPGLTVMAPMDERELVEMLHTALRIDGPVAVRYPRGTGIGVPLPERPEPIEIGRGRVIEAGERVALVGYGYGAALAVEAADLVADGIGARPTVVDARFCKPIDATLIRQLADRHELLVTIEDHAAMAGFGSAVLEVLEDTPSRVLRVGLPDRFIDHGKRELLLEEAGLTAAQVAARTVRALGAASRMLVAEG